MPDHDTDIIASAASRAWAKQAAARWRMPDALLTALRHWPELGQKFNGYPTQNRINQLELVKQKLLGAGGVEARQPDYVLSSLGAKLQSLPWVDITRYNAKNVQNFSKGVTPPRIYRGYFAPHGNNWADAPDFGNLVSGVAHGTPNPAYAGGISATGPGGLQMVKTFKPQPDQRYFSDFGIEAGGRGLLAAEEGASKVKSWLDIKRLHETPITQQHTKLPPSLVSPKAVYPNPDLPNDMDLGGDVAHLPATPMWRGIARQLGVLNTPAAKHAAATAVHDSRTADIADKFQPDYTPEQLEHLGVYDALYRNQGPRLASLGEWKPEWVSEHDPKGWAQWYKRYSSGRRIPEEDERQIKRWASFKARHGSSFTKNPTPRRGWALRNWGIDPAKLVTNDARNGVVTMLADYQRKAMQKYVQDKIAQAQRGDVFSVSCHERTAEVEPSQVVRVAPAFFKSADLLPEVQLQEHQQRIADEVTEDEPRMLVYHGLGSGKSLSALAAAEAAKRKFGGNYGIVAPASLKGNFEKEIAKFTTGSDPEVMSYTGLGLGKKFQEQPETLIMDEAHRLRNPGAASSQAAAQAAARAKRLLLLTGSPVTNEPSDMANLLSLIHNKNITPEEFNRQYVGQKTVRPGIMGWLRGAKPGVKPVIKNEAELRKLLAGHVDYQASKTPDGVNVNEQTVRVPLSAEQQKIQKAIRTKIPPGFLWKLDNEFPLSREELSKLNSFMTGMRQVSLSTQPFRADKDPGKSFTQSAKLQEAFKNLQTTLKSDPRKKAIIYSNFVDSGLAPYASALEKAKVPHGFFHGGVSPKARQAAVDAYNAGKLRALLIGPAGAEGLSTKGTSLIQLLDPHWNETRSQQARGRGLRFDSHVGLPEELKNVAVQRYLSSSEDPSIVGKLMGYKRERTGDEVLERLTAEKEQANEEFRRILREEGSKHHADPEKLAALFTPMKLQSTRLVKKLKNLKLRPSAVKLVGRTAQPTLAKEPEKDISDQSEIK